MLLEAPRIVRRGQRKKGANRCVLFGEGEGGRKTVKRIEWTRSERETDQERKQRLSIDWHCDKTLIGVLCFSIVSVLLPAQRNLTVIDYCCNIILMMMMMIRTYVLRRVSEMSIDPTGPSHATTIQCAHHLHVPTSQESTNDRRGAILTKQMALLLLLLAALLATATTTQAFVPALGAKGRAAPAAARSASVAPRRWTLPALPSTTSSESSDAAAASGGGSETVLWLRGLSNTFDGTRYQFKDISLSLQKGQSVRLYMRGRRKALHLASVCEFNGVDPRRRRNDVHWFTNATRKKTKPQVRRSGWSA